MLPRVRVVVLNYDGGDLTLRCLESLERLDWPPERLEVLVVDNGSRDGSAAAVRAGFPAVELIEAGRNLGFAAGNNVGLRELGSVDHVALLNNDAAVEPGWLQPLVEALEADPGLGAACPKILFAPRFVDVELRAAPFAPGRGDPRTLSLRLSGVEVDGADRGREAQHGPGWHAPEQGPGGEPVFRWMGPAAKLRVPAGRVARLRLAAEREKMVELRSGSVEAVAPVGPGPAWVEVALGGEPYDVVNNAGSVLVAGGYGGDRGFLEPDRGQYDEPAEVFAWCGCSVLLRRGYLEEVGLFDERLFLYYEDFDLSWRGRAQGWRYLYVPRSVVRHVHSATSVEGSPLFQHYVERNRLLVHVKNAPAGYAARAVAGWLLPTAWFAARDVVSPLLHGRRPRLGLVRRRVRALGAFARLLPAAVAERRRLRRRQRVPDAELVAWAVRR